MEHDPTYTSKLGVRCPSEGKEKGKGAVQYVERQLPVNFIPSSSVEAEFSCGNEPEPPLKRGRPPAHGPGEHVKHGEAEQRCQDKLNHLYDELRPVVPNGSMLDEGSLLGAAAAYILELQRKIQAQEMRTEVEGSANPNVVTQASSASTLRSHDNNGTSRNFQAEHMLDNPIVDIDIMGREAIVRVSRSKEGNNVFSVDCLLLSTLRDLQMTVHHGHVFLFKNRGYHLFFAEMDEAKILSQDQLLGAINTTLGSLRL